MGFKALNDAGVADLLLNAKIILKERGHAKGGTYDPDTGAVDARGALFLAAGAKPANVMGFVTAPEDAGVPPLYIAKVYAAFDMIEGLYGDIEEWNDNSEQEYIEKGFTKLANLIQISIT
jgi:hypothetical protein